MSLQARRFVCGASSVVARGVWWIFCMCVRKSLPIKGELVVISPCGTEGLTKRGVRKATGDVMPEK